MDGFGPAGQDIQRFADVDYRNAMSKQVDGTGGWLFKAPKFIAWRDSPLSTPILWLYGSRTSALCFSLHSALLINCASWLREDRPEVGIPLWSPGCSTPS